MNIRKSWVFDVIVLVWCLTFLSSITFAQDNSEHEYRQGQKPVVCTKKPYNEVKAEFANEYGEVGMIRYKTTLHSIVEVLVNKDKGTVTILEFLPSANVTCVISDGGELEYNSIFGNNGITT